MKKSVIMSAFFLMSIGLTGCGESGRQENVQVLVNEYEKITYESVEVVRGDIEPTLSLKLQADDFEQKSYFPKQDEMEVEQIYVKKGDTVQAGDVMITFKSGDIAKQIEEYENRLEETRLLIEHYTQLSQIDASVDYSNDIQMLKDDMEVTSLYIQELNAKLDSYSIKAEGAGVVYIVSDIANYGIVNSTDIVLTVVYGSGEYLATTTDDYDFRVGEKYTATYGIASYELELVSIEEDGKDVNGDTVRWLTFSMASDEEMSENSTLNIVVYKPVLKDVLYVPEDAVFDVDEKYYVYTLDEEGFRHAVEVKTGSTVDGYTVIESGVSEGDKVVIR